MFQDRFLYFPEKTRSRTSSPKGLGAWPAPDELRASLQRPRPRAGTVVVFHGNAGHVGSPRVLRRDVTEFGLRVILAEYPAMAPRGPTG